MKIPRTMSTQHPDNVRSPFFATSSVISGNDEIKEAFYAYSHLKIKEQLWDFEGKDVDSSVVKKLLMRYEMYFSNHKLGKDMNLTYRVPNPDVEKKEGKLLLETLESIPRSFDAARLFYGEDIAPIFEVSVPMVTNSTSIIRIAEYYKKFVVDKENKSLFDGDHSLSSWVGEFMPKKIRVIPLIEDRDSMLNAHHITEEFITSQKVDDYQRVWLARSDPALNYGSTTTVLIEKTALQRLHQVQEKLSVNIAPMLGCGSCPFRGNFKPTNVEQNMKAYPSVETFTLQSAFKYDYDEAKVRDAVNTIESAKSSNPLVVDEERILPIIEKLSNAYRQQIQLLAPIINDFSAYIPKRRARKLHVGLFGYSRSKDGITLPRAIKFCASLYSLGLPPELLGLHVLNGNDIDKIHEVYPSFEMDFKDAVQYLNTDNLSFFPLKIAEQVRVAAKLFDTEVNENHKKVSSIILEDFKAKRPVIAENIERAGWIRGFLG